MSNSKKEEALAEALRQAREATSQVSDAARKIWLAGLGAFAKANAEGGELFSKLMKQGSDFEAKTRQTAGERIGTTRATLEDTVERAARQGKESWTKVEKAVTEQVKRSLDKLGVAGQKDLEAMNQRIDQIAEGVRKAAAARAGAAAAPPSAAEAAKATDAKKPAAPKKAAASRPITPTSSATAKKAAVKKASDAIASRRAAAKAASRPPPKARKRDEIADIASELEKAQLAAYRAAHPKPADAKPAAKKAAKPVAKTAAKKTAKPAAKAAPKKATKSAAKPAAKSAAKPAARKAAAKKKK